jgi:predicted O-linked N-acetylglucosamine transferase (SPINDLY family)
VAHTPNDYVRIAVELASDPARLAALRASSRERFSRIIGDGPALSRRFESAVRSVWRDWCTAQTA